MPLTSEAIAKLDAYFAEKDTPKSGKNVYSILHSVFRQLKQDGFITLFFYPLPSTIIPDQDYEKIKEKYGTLDENTRFPSVKMYLSEFPDFEEDDVDLLECIDCRDGGGLMTFSAAYACVIHSITGFPPRYNSEYLKAFCYRYPTKTGSVNYRVSDLLPLFQKHVLIAVGNIDIFRSENRIMYEAPIEVASLTKRMKFECDSFVDTHTFSQDILKNIFQHLTFRFAFNTLNRVCRAWNDAVETMYQPRMQCWNLSVYRNYDDHPLFKDRISHYGAVKIHLINCLNDPSAYNGLRFRYYSFGDKKFLRAEQLIKYIYGLDNEEVNYLSCH